jgi:N-methylhydantoinase B
MPEKTFGDIRAQISSLMVGTDRINQLYSKYGKEMVQQSCDDLLNYSERRMRSGLKKIADGVYTAIDYIDDDGVNDEPIKVSVKIEIKGDKVTVDLTDSDPQAEGNTNSTLANTHAAVYYVLIAVVDPHMPPNSGCYRPIEVQTKPGSIVDPVLPGAVAARTNCSQKIVEAMYQAFAAITPDRVTAGSHGQITTCGFGGADPINGERFIYTEIQVGGNGARPFKDGADGQDGHLPRFMNTPVEAVESRFPVRVERYEFIPDSGGAGTYRGSLAMVRDIRLLADNVSFARYADRHTHAPFGLFGGKEGSKGAFLLNPGTDDEMRLKSKGLDLLNMGDLISLRMPGAGGYGDPLERDLNLIDTDLKNQKISPNCAEDDYQVLLDGSGQAVDHEQTMKHRKER